MTVLNILEILFLTVLLFLVLRYADWLVRMAGALSEPLYVSRKGPTGTARWAAPQPQKPRPRMDREAFWREGVVRAKR